MAGRSSAVAGGDGTTKPLPGPAAAEAELRVIARDWAEAIVSNEADRIAGFVTDDWMVVSESGLSAGTRLLGLIETGDLAHTRMTTVSDTHVRILGDTAVVTARIRNTAIYRGAQFDADEWTTDVYVRRGNRWLCTLTHYTAAAEPT